MYEIISIKDMLENNGEEVTSKFLSIFSSGNDEVDNFVHKKAIEFCKRNRTMSYIVFQNKQEKIYFVGFFSITLKIASILSETVNKLPNSSSRKIKESSLYSIVDGKYNVPAYLIAQFGKNYNSEGNISGEKLMEYVFEKLNEVQSLIGGSLAWVECEKENEKAFKFYTEKMNFKIFGQRVSEEGEEFYKLIRKI